MTKSHEHEEEIIGKSHTVKVGIISAALAAFTTYFLYGTKKGAHTREVITKRADKIKHKVANTADDLIETATDIRDNMTSLLKERSEQFKNLSAKDIAGIAGRLHDRWEETKKDIEETLENASEKE